MLFGDYKALSKIPYLIIRQIRILETKIFFDTFAMLLIINHMKNNIFFIPRLGAQVGLRFMLRDLGLRI